MSNQWRAIGLPSVRREEIKVALKKLELDWGSVAHITATSSLSKSIRTNFGNAQNIGQFIEMLILPSMPVPFKLDLTEFPDARSELTNLEELTKYELRESAWRAIVSGRQMKIGLEFNQKFREFLADSSYESEIKNILRREKRSIRQGVQTLLAAGFGFENINAPFGKDSGRAIDKAIVDAWEYLETNFEPLTAYRDVLWIDKDEYISQTDQKSKVVKKLLLRALDIAFGPVNGPRTIVHHGFYFYTPPQWALFQLLRNTPGINQVFIIHDDGMNPAFETWRKFFKTDWLMPEIEYLEGTESSTIQANAYGEILKGKAVSFEGLEEKLNVIKCRTPADFSRHISQARLEFSTSEPQLFAAQPEEVERFVELDVSNGVIASTNLAFLPVGIFLLGVHRSIDMSDIDKVKIAIQGQTLIDIASTNFIEGNFDSYRLTNSLKKVLPYFRDCVSSDEWRSRLDSLREVVLSRISSFGSQYESELGVIRINAIAENPIRLVSWVDLSETEIDELIQFVTETVNLIEHIADAESRNLRSYLEFLSAKLESGLRNEHPQIQQEVLKKLNGFSIGTGNKYDIDGLIEVVEILLGQQAEFSGIGEDDSDLIVKPLRALDSLGFIRSKGDVLVTNLCDGVFPSKHDPLPWPFNLGQLTGNYEIISKDILRDRSQFSTLSDLYLLWLALDGVDLESKVILSWIAELPGEDRDLSSLIKLLMIPERLSGLIREHVGGIRMSTSSAQIQIQPTKDFEVPLIALATDSQIETAITLVNGKALASAFVCERRFAIQWALGPSAAYQSEHIQRMLFGNFQSIFYKFYKLPWEASVALSQEIWKFMSLGQRESSLAKRVIKTNGADPNWIFTLNGSRGTGRNGAYDIAYQTALGIHALPTAEKLVDAGITFLPSGVKDSKICSMCPVKPSCSQAMTSKK